MPVAPSPLPPFTARPRKEIWSATPTPFLPDFSLDTRSIERLVEHHCAHGVSGLMLAGTCGEGPWMPREEIVALVRHTASVARGRLKVAVQVTDNSSLQMLRQIEAVARAGADYAVVAAPGFFMNATPARLVAHYRETIRQSALPVAFYERGAHASYALSTTALEEVLAEPNLHFIKDSSSDVERQRFFLGIAAKRPGLRLFVGDEFQCASYLEAGYHGALLGGGIFNAGLVARIIDTLERGDCAGALQERMNRLMFHVYGGEKIECWLTGLKHLLVEMGLFQTTTGFLGYPLTEECRAAIAGIVHGEDREGYRRDLHPTAASVS